jgi:hypothetical protein
LAVGSLQLAVGSWQLAVGSWQLAVGSWQLAVGSWQFSGRGVKKNLKREGGKLKADFEEVEGLVSRAEGHLKKSRKRK